MLWWAGSLLRCRSTSLAKGGSGDVWWDLEWGISFGGFEERDPLPPECLDRSNQNDDDLDRRIPLQVS